MSRKPYRLKDLIAQCDPGAPMPEALKEWEHISPVGLEQAVFNGEADIMAAIQVFAAALSTHFTFTQLILFGSRARGDHRPDSDADVAVILAGEPGDFVETKLAMARIAFDVLQETGVLIQAFPIWEREWADPESYSNPGLLRNIAWEGVIVFLCPSLRPVSRSSK